MATAPALISMEQYLRTSYHPDADYIDGQVQERNLGESDHAQLQFLLAAAFAPQQRAWRISGRIEQRIRVSPTRVRICDVALLRSDAPYETVTATPR